MTKHWDRVTIVGCGLIGASFALALRRANACARIAGWDSAGSELEAALRAGVIDEVDQAFAGSGISSSDLVYLAMPVGGIIEFLRERGGQINPGTLVTDAGSTKVEICRAAQLNLKGKPQFIGGHPVAGSHLQGLAHARSDLFAGAPYVLVTSGNDNDKQAQAKLEETLDQLGASVIYMIADEHDRVMAFVSHLPQIVSSALAAVTNEQPDADALVSLAGAGYRDMTRLASSSWSMWGDILTTNSTEAVAALDALIEKLTAVRYELANCSQQVGVELPVTRRLFRDSGPS